MSDFGDDDMCCDLFGGAEDSNAFTNTIQSKSALPKPATIAYEGVFAEHYYKITPEKELILSVEADYRKHIQSVTTSRRETRSMVEYTCEIQ